MTRIYVADDDVELRSALRLLLEQQPGDRVVGEAAHSHGLVALVDSAQADLVLLDWELPGGVGGWLLDALHQLTRRPCIIVLGSSPDQSADALHTGADAFADKSTPPHHLLGIIATQSPCWHGGRC